MSGIARQSRWSETFPDTDSPVIISHASWAGLGLNLSNASATVTVEADISASGDFENEVTMLGDTTKIRYPDAAGANLLYNAAFIKITWDTGTLQVFQKG